MKKLISIALVAVMAAGGAVSANAAVKQNKDYQILSSKIATKKQHYKYLHIQYEEYRLRRRICT